MKVSQFINNVLFAEDSGYYRRKNPLGKTGDFITAPEISQIFGELLAAYLLNISSNYKNKIALVEMGAGKGTLFFDVLSTITKLAENKNPQALDFLSRGSLHIIEINETLIEVQQKKLSKFKIKWHKNFAEFLQKISAEEKIFFFANELFDCFPIDQFVKTDIGWCERIIEEKNKKLQFVTSNFDPKINEFVTQKLGAGDSISAPFGAVFEYSKSAQDFMAQLCQAMKSQGGIAINFDYGYIKRDFANTLQALKNHQKVAVLESPGEADITALVDFSALIEIAKKFNLQNSIISQREFLLALGVEERRKELLKNKSSKEQEEINLAIDRLVDADKMGELFKCLIIW